MSLKKTQFPEFKIAGFPIDGVGFKNLSLTNKIYPNGPVSWCWAPLGDKLVNTFQTPAMFINAPILMIRTTSMPLL